MLSIPEKGNMAARIDFVPMIRKFTSANQNWAVWMKLTSL